jgi:hypothetical protein
MDRRWGSYGMLRRRYRPVLQTEYPELRRRGPMVRKPHARRSLEAMISPRGVKMEKQRYADLERMYLHRSHSHPQQQWWLQEPPSLRQDWRIVP